MISNINLLPWRAEQRALQKRNFLLTLGFSALSGLLAAAIIFTYFSSQISGQEERNKFLEDKIATEETKIKEVELLDEKRARLLGRKEVIDTLQLDRSRIVRLFEALVKATPDGVMLTLVEQNQEGLSIEGRAQSSTRVSTYMRNLEASGWMNKPDLTIIEDSGKPKDNGKPGASGSSVEANFPYVFKLSVGLTKPEEGEVPTPDIVVEPTPVAVAADAAAPVAPGAVKPLVEVPSDTPVAPVAPGPIEVPVDARGAAPEVPTSSSNTGQKP